MRNVLIISNVHDPCHLLPSESRRSGAFGRFLPEFGWRCIHLVLACQCHPDGSTMESEYFVEQSLFPDPTVLDAVKQDLSNPDSTRPIVLRVRCAPVAATRLYYRLCNMEAHTETIERNRQEMDHFVFPAPVRKSRPSIFSPLLKPLRIASAYWANVMHTEQERIDWVPRATSFAVELMRNVTVDVVVASFSTAQNLIIGKNIARATGMSMIADFRDAALRKRVDRVRSTKELNAIRHALRESRAITAVTPQEAERDLPLSDKPRFIIENGYSEDSFARDITDSPSPDEFVMRFLGTIYPDRNLDTFLKGFAHFLTNPETDRSRIRFEYYGTCWPEVTGVVSSLGLTENCSVNQPVSIEEAFRLTRSATVVIMQTNTVGMSGVPGAKLYELLASQRPILAAGGPDEYVADVLEKTHAGVLCCSPQAVAATLSDWHSTWQTRGSFNLTPDMEQVQKYSRRNSTRKLAALLDAVVDNKPISPANLDNL